MTAVGLHPFQAFLERLALLVEALGEAVAGRAKWEGLERPLYDSALMRLQRLFGCVHRAVLAARSGRTGRAPQFPHPAASSGNPRRRRVPAGEVPLPRGFGWLVRLVPGAEIYGAGLAEIVSDPCLVALLANAPKARQSLRSLCVMLGADSPIFILPPVRLKASEGGMASGEAAGRDPGGVRRPDGSAASHVSRNTTPAALQGPALHPSPLAAEAVPPDRPRHFFNLAVMRR